MRALLLAAGLGQRLRPLTLTKPKALVPIANRPSIVRLLELLRPYGIDETFINLHYFPEGIKDVLGAGTEWDTRIHYSFEPELLGTAGAIGKIGKFLADDRFLLVNTDIVTDIDLSGAMEFHEKTGAKATLILATPPEDPDYQKIGVGPDGRILMDRASGDVLRNGVYTGIGMFEPSVLNLIPKDYSSLLETVLIPLAKEGSLFTYFADKYWKDFGSIERYLAANKDVISGKVSLPIDGRPVSDNLWIAESAEIDLTVSIEEPALIGERVCIERGARIGPYTILGNGCTVGPGVDISNSVLWCDCTIGANSTIENSIIADTQEVKYGQRLKRIILHRGVSEPMFNI